MNPTTATFPVLSSAIDWITATTTGGLSQQMLVINADRWMQARAVEGYRAHDWKWMGYVGATIDGLSVGERPDGACVRVSGELAAKHGATVLRLARNVSRLDVQVTLLDDGGEFNWHTFVRDQAKTDARVESGMTSVTHIDRWPSGRSCYIGSRSSDRYFRAYDKWAESEGAWPAGSWRWEIEYKASRASRVASYLMKRECSAEAVRSIVQQGFQDYGVRMPTETLPTTWRDKGTRSETDDQRRLAWLATSIAPMIGRLRESTPEDVILDVLGLGDAAAFKDVDALIAEWESLNEVAPMWTELPPAGASDAEQ